MQTLYSLLKKYEEELPLFEKEAFDNYHNNNVLKRAISGEQTIEVQLKKIGKVRQGWRKFVPLFHNKEHNEEVQQIEELVSPVSQLELNMDSEIASKPAGIAAYITGLAFGTSYFANILLRGEGFNEPTALADSFEYSKVLLPIYFSLITIPLVSLGMMKKIPKPPLEQAKYIDQKIEKFYRIKK